MQTWDKSEMCCKAVLKDNSVIIQLESVQFIVNSVNLSFIKQIWFSNKAAQKEMFF